MMQRLIDQRGQLSSEDAELLTLLDSVEPVASDPFAKRRGLVRLRGQRAGRLSRWSSPLAVALLLITAGASAAILEHESIVAAMGRWFGGTSQPEMLPAPVATTSRPSAETTPIEPETLPQPAMDEASLEAETLPEPEPEPTTQPHKARRHVPAARSKTASASKRELGEDPSQVAAALRALRSESDPAKAQQLLGEYLETNPNGALSEDALALSIEAAAARKDPRAKEYARRYLGRFPNGRYRQLALQVLAR